MNIRFERLNVEDYQEYIYALYLINREFFRRIAPDLRREDILKIESICQGNFYLIYNDSSNLGIGFLTRVDNSGLSCHLGLLLEPRFQDKVTNEGNKIAFYVMTEFMRYVFKHTHLRKISLCFLKKREDLVKSVVRGGFNKEAEFKEAVYFEGKFQDELEYSIFKDDFIKLYGEIV